jgi:hemoglobin-like flavoprotein
MGYSRDRRAFVSKKLTISGKTKYVAGGFAALALLGAACSSNNNNNANKNANSAAANNAATTAATATKTATSAPTAAGTSTSMGGMSMGSATAAAKTATPAAAGTPAAEVTTTSPAADLRVTLDRLLAEHADLAIVAMQKGYDGAPDFQAAANQLDQNSQALAKAIGSVYGDAAGQKFLDLWRAHIGMFVNYTQAVAKNDDAGKQKAMNDLANYGKDFAAFINGANPNIPSDAVVQLLQAHVQELIGALDAYAKKDYATAYKDFDEAHNHMFMTGDALAAGIIKQQGSSKLPGNAMSNAVNLRVTLDNLLSEHATLAIIAMQKGVAGAPDFQAAANQLDQNSQALAKAIGSIYGDAAGQKFLDLWRAHIGMFVNYTQGVAKNDAATKQKALDDLSNYRKDFAAFINGADPKIPADAVANLLQSHVQQLVDALNSYVAKDYATTYKSFDDSFTHMFMTGDALAAGFVAQYPNKFAALLTPSTVRYAYTVTLNNLPAPRA